MDALFVRTKLQALIAAELRARGELRARFLLVKIFQFSEDEDDETVYRQYRRLERDAKWVWSDVTARSFLRSFLRAFGACLTARFSGGRVFNANITYYPFALALKLVPGTRLCTFDDGFTNIVPENSPYFVETPLPGAGWKRRLLAKLFPSGAASYVRSRVERHFTIYPGRRNIVPDDRLVALELDWEQLLSAADIERLRRPVRAVLIGTKYDEWPPDLDLRAIVAGLADEIDLYLPHPRETIVLHPGKAIRLDGPAESAIHHLLRSGPLTLYHLDSSVGHSFLGHPAVEVRNVVPEWRLEDVPPVA